MRKDCWSAIATACLLAAMIGTAVSSADWRGSRGLSDGEVKGGEPAADGRTRMLQIDEAQLLSPARLDEFASRQNLSYPGRGQETHLQPKDAAFAMNVAPTTATTPQ